MFVLYVRMSVSYVIMISWIKINNKLHRERPLRDLMKCSLPMEGMFCINLISSYETLLGSFIMIPENKFTVEISLEVFQS